MSAEEQKTTEQDIPAIRDVGKTVESTSEYYAVASPGYSTPEGRIAAEAGPVNLD